MTVIIIFWVSSDNLIDVIKRDTSRTIDDQVNQYANERGYKLGVLFGIEKYVIEQ